jgi:AcrR family transcriptional regulator
MPRIRAGTLKEHKHLTRNEIIDAAHRLFVHRGFHVTSLGAVADAVGVARTTLYEYFPNKEELLLGVIRDRVGPAIEHLVTTRPVHDDPARVITGMLEQLVHFTAEHNALARALLQAGRKLPRSAQEDVSKVVRPYAELLGDLCEDGIARGLLAGSSPAALARILGDHFIGAVDEVIRAEDPGAIAPSIAAHRVDFLRRALRPNGAR